MFAADTFFSIAIPGTYTFGATCPMGAAADGPLLWLMLALQLPLFSAGCAAGAETPSEGYIAAGAGAARVAEAAALADAASDAIEALPIGHRARDELRALRGKLKSVASVAGLTEPDEWDEMLRALLDAKFYGIDDLRALLGQPAEGWSGEAAAAATSEASCSGEGPRLSPGRRRLLSANGAGGDEYDDDDVPAAWISRTDEEAEMLIEQEEAEMEARAWAAAMRREAELLSGSSWLYRRVIEPWVRWMRDRPPPWERDCDCCFAVCPPDRNCLSQTDGLYLACRGESLGEIADKLWARSPLLVSTCALAALLALALCVRQQARAFRRRSGAAADDDDSDDDEDEDEDESGGEDSADGSRKKTD